MDRNIIDLLRREGRPRSALQISKGVGKVTAKDVNPTLYRLEKEGCVQRMGKFKDGPAPLWRLVQGGSSHGNRAANTAFEDSILQILRGTPQQPLSALDICHKLGRSRDKTSVNRVLYHLLDKGRVHMARGSGPTEQTPMWSLAATSSRPSPTLTSADVPIVRPTSASATSSSQSSNESGTQYSSGSGTQYSSGSGSGTQYSSGSVTQYGSGSGSGTQYSSGRGTQYSSDSGSGTQYSSGSATPQKRPSSTGSSDLERKVLDQLASKQTLTAARLAHLIGCETKLVKSLLYSLADKGQVHIEHRGGSSGQQPFWALKNPSVGESPPMPSQQMNPAQSSPSQLRRLAGSGIANPVPIGIGRGRGVLGLPQPPLIGDEQPQGEAGQSDVEQQHQADVVMEAQFQEPASHEDKMESVPASDSIADMGEGSGCHGNMPAPGPARGGQVSPSFRSAPGWFTEAAQGSSSGGQTGSNAPLREGPPSYQQAELECLLLEKMEELSQPKNADDLTKDLGLERGRGRAKVQQILNRLKDEGKVKQFTSTFPVLWILAEDDAASSNSGGSYRDRSPLMLSRNNPRPVAMPLGDSNPSDPSLSLHSPEYSPPCKAQRVRQDSNSEVEDLDEAIKGFCVQNTGGEVHRNPVGLSSPLTPLQATHQADDMEVEPHVPMATSSNAQGSAGMRLGVGMEPSEMKMGLFSTRPLGTAVGVTGQSPIPNVSAPHVASIVNDLSKNPVSALFEVCQKMKLELELIDVRESGPSHEPTFVSAAKFGSQYFEAEGSSKKEARRKACDLALQSIQCHLQADQENDHQHGSGPSGPVVESAAHSSDSFADSLAAQVQQTYSQLAKDLVVAQPGRKVVAGFVMTTLTGNPPTVVSIGTGTRCIEGDKLSLEGVVVHDSHAEVVARRSLLRYFYRQLHLYFSGNEDTIFVPSSSEENKLVIREGVEFHLYISTAPCGDGAQFSRGDGNEDSREPVARGTPHNPTMVTKQQGLLRTKMEGGEGTIPIKPEDGEQTWDGIQMGGRLRTMSCSDKVCRWNILGLQGALLSHFVSPIYLSSITLGSLHHHGHLSRAVCCRFDRMADLPAEYRVNHPYLTRVTGGDDMKRHTEKTINYSCNWSLGDKDAELCDGVIGRPLSSASATFGSVSRIAKASLFAQFHLLCRAAQRDDLAGQTLYLDAKQLSASYQAAKTRLFEESLQKGYGRWMRKPTEISMFDSTIVFPKYKLAD